MKRDSIVRIYCATCHESLELCYSHGSLSAKTLADDIKHDATVSSDWHLRDGLFYCDKCGDSQENTRDDRAAQGRLKWRHTLLRLESALNGEG